MNHPYLILDTAPASEPISTAQAKAFLRVEHDDEDTVIDRLITSARQKAENYLGRSLITQSWKMAYDDYAPSRVKLLRGPVQSITSVTNVTSAGVETTLSSSAYYLGAGNETLYFDVQPVGDIIEILYTAGYGTASDVPEQIVQGMLMHIAAMYDARDGSLKPDGAVRNLYDDYRVVAI